jgi:hypothetical protein
MPSPVPTVFMASESKAAPSDGSPDVLRSILSILIFAHLFCVAVVLSSNLRRSALQSRLVKIFAGYTQLLDFDPDFTPYYYTFGRDIDGDARLVIDLYADADLPVTAQPLVKTVTLPEGGSNWLGDRRRYFSLARIMALNSQPENENDELTSEIAKAVGGRVMRENNAKRSVVRCIQRLTQPLDLSLLNPGFPPDNPTDARYDQMPYEADVWIDEDNLVQVIKRASRAEVAPRQNAPATTPSTATPSAMKSTQGS